MSLDAASFTARRTPLRATPMSTATNTAHHIELLRQVHDELEARKQSWEESVIELDRATGAYARAYGINADRPTSPRVRAISRTLTYPLATLVLIVTCVFALVALG